MSRGGTRFSAALAALLLVLAACGGDGEITAGRTPGATGEGEPQRGGDLVFARPEDNTTMDSVVAVETETIYVLNHIFETLYVTSDDGQNTEAWLAESEEVSADNLTWTIHLRPGVTFSDGSPVTAEDVKWSLDRARADTSGFGFLLGAIDNIETPDESTVVIHTKFPWKPLKADLALWAAAVMPAKFGGKSQEEFFESPIGTGPFVLDHWTRGTELKVVRNENYWQEGKPYVDSVTWKQVPDGNTRVLQLKGGQAHIISDVPFNVIEDLQNTPGVEGGTFPGTVVYYILFNTREPPFDDVHVRRAIAFAINKQEMAEAVLFGYGGPACSIIAPTVAFHDPNTPCLQFDLDQAKAELAQSSVPDGFETEFLVPTEPAPTAIAEIIQQQLAPIGIEVTLRPIDPGQLYETIVNLDYEMAWEGWSMDIPDPDEQISFMLDLENGGGDSYSTGYGNPEVIDLLRQAQQEFDEAERAELYSRIQAIHAEEVPHLPLVFQEVAFGWSDQVHDFFVNPVGNRHLEDVWLSE